jgi:hypothetical protein
LKDRSRQKRMQRRKAVKGNKGASRALALPREPGVSKRDAITEYVKVRQPCNAPAPARSLFATHTKGGEEWVDSVHAKRDPGRGALVMHALVRERGGWKGRSHAASGPCDTRCIP